MQQHINRGNIFMANLNPVIGSEQGGVRPVLILQNDTGNKYSPTTIVASISTKVYSKSHLPTHFLITPECGVNQSSVVLLEQIKTIDKSRLIKKLGELTDNEMMIIDRLIKVSLGIN